MNNPAYVDLTSPQKEQLRSALRRALPKGPAVEIDEDGVMSRGDELLVPVRAATYPNAMFEFMQALATAEIEVRDAGLKVRLLPDIRQRMLVVGTPNGLGSVAYLSSDGTEYEDLAQTLGIDEKSLMSVKIEGYAYDDDEDLAQALEEAKRDWPDADFSRVPGG